MGSLDLDILYSTLSFYCCLTCYYGSTSYSGCSIWLECLCGFGLSFLFGFHEIFILYVDNTLFLFRTIYFILLEFLWTYQWVFDLNLSTRSRWAPKITEVSWFLVFSGWMKVNTDGTAKGQPCNISCGVFLGIPIGLLIVISLVTLGMVLLLRLNLLAP